MRQLRGPEPDPPGVESYEFLVPGRPVSVHEKNRARFKEWIDDLKTAARRVWPGYPPFSHWYARMTIVFLCEEKDRVDVDNVIKPIVDALETMYFGNDEMVSDVDSHRRYLNDAEPERGLPDLLREPWLERRPCAYVRIEDSRPLGDVL